MRRIILSTIAIIAIVIFVLAMLTSNESEAQSSKPVARIEFYPANGGPVQSYLAYSIEGFSDGYVRFKTKDGNEVILNGSWTVIKF